VDAVYKPLAGKDTYLKGVLAKKILQHTWKPTDKQHPTKTYQMLSSVAGGAGWPRQPALQGQRMADAAGALPACRPPPALATPRLPPLQAAP
jgi:hypothetical protein